MYVIVQVDHHQTMPYVERHGENICPVLNLIFSLVKCITCTNQSLYIYSKTRVMLHIICTFLLTQYNSDLVGSFGINIRNYLLYISNIVHDHCYIIYNSITS